MDTVNGGPVLNEGSYTEKPCRGFTEDHREFLHEHPHVPSRTLELNRRLSPMNTLFMSGHIGERYSKLVSRGKYLLSQSTPI